MCVHKRINHARVSRVRNVTEYAGRSVHTMIDQCFFPVIETLSLLSGRRIFREVDKKKKKRKEINCLLVEH